MSVDLYLTGDAGTDAFTIVRSGSSDLIYHNQPLTSTPFETVPISTLGTVNIFGNGGADSVTVDYSGGDPIPGSLYFAAGGGAVHSTITVIGVAAGTGYAPNYTLSPGELTITTAAITDTIDFANVDRFGLFSSGSGSLTVAGGSVTFNQDLGASGGAVDVTVDDGASLYFGVTQHLDNLTIDSGGTAAMLPAGGQLLDTNTLTVDGVLDLANNDLLVNTPDSTDMTTLQEQVAAGVTDAASSSGIGTTQGLIYSSTAAVDGLTLGVDPASNISLSTLDGQTVPTGSLVARYTSKGDTNLDGVVNYTDLSAILQNYGNTLGTTPPMRYDGDLNYDGVVNYTDLSAVLQTYGTTAIAAPTAVTLGDTLTLTLPTLPDGTSATRWDIYWGDGTINSYDGGNTSASHVFTATGTDLVQFQAVTYNSTTGYGTYYAPAQSLVITATGVTATPLTLTASASTDTYTVSADGSGDTIITKDGTTVEDEPTADILALSITGSAANVTIDFTNGDPLPAAGIFSDAADITLTGPHGTDSLITTSTAAMLGDDTIRYPATTTLTDSLTSSAGVYALAGSVTLSSIPSTSDVTVATGATALFNGSQTLNSLTINPGGTAREISPVTTLGATVLTIGTVTIDAPDTQGDAGGVLDLGNGDLITSDTSVATIQRLLAAGYDGGLWDGESATGPNPASIVSSGAANDPYQIEALGYAAIGTAAGSLNLSAFDGQAVSSGDVVVALTYYGDANLDREVNATDSGMTIGSPDVVITAPIGWATGDFNYDGVVDDVDSTLAADTSITISNLSGSTGEIITAPNGGLIETKQSNGFKDVQTTVTVTNNGAPVANDGVKDVASTNPPGVNVGPTVTVSGPTDANGQVTVTFSVGGLPPGDYQVQLDSDGGGTIVITVRIDKP